jgi:ssDNA-binding Zn-finger/Zn-ribbon topoisomerase 1
MADAMLGLVAMALLTGAWIVPIVLGLKAACEKGVSPHWMWFGLHPVGGWIAFAIIRRGVTRIPCPSCMKLVPATGGFCPHCSATLANWVPSENRIRASGVLCASCNTTVPYNATYCPVCSTPIPHLACPACHSPKTIVKSSTGIHVTGAILVLLPAAAHLAYLESGGRPGLGAMWIIIGPIISAWCFYAAFSRHSKQINCVACGKSSKLTTRDVQVLDCPVERQREHEASAPPTKAASPPRTHQSQRVIVRCQNCGQRLQIRQTALGKQVTCPKCDTTFVPESEAVR